MSIMKKIFSFGNNKLQKSRSTTKRFQPQLEPLEDRHLLSVSSLLASAVPGTLNQNDTHAEMQLQIGTQTGGNSVVGIRVDATTADFNPSAITVYNENNVKISGNAIKYLNADYGGASSSLLMVELAPGNYTIRVGGDKETYGSFVCDVFLPGDFNHDHAVSNTELKLGDAAVLASQGLLNDVTMSAWQKMGYSKADILAQGNSIDIDRDGKVSGFEIDTVVVNSVAGKVTATIISDNIGPKISAQLAVDDGVSHSDKITSKPGVSGNVSDESDIASFKASFNGTDWVDVTCNENGDFALDDDFLKTMVGSPVDGDGNVVDGRYTLHFKAEDSYGNINDAYSFDYVVIANNTPPTADGDTFTITEKEKLENISLTNLYGDSDIGDIVSIVPGTVKSAKNFDVVINADGTFSYDPGDFFHYLNENGLNTSDSDTFKFTVIDAMGETTEATITITINGINDAPVAANISDATTDQDTNEPIDVIALATDIDNAKTDLSIGSFTQPQKGRVEKVGNELIFYPGDDFKGLTGAPEQQEMVTFTYTVTDGDKESVAKTVTITVTGKYDAPKANNDTTSIVVKADGSDFENGDKGIVISDILANDIAVDNGSTVELVEDGFIQSSKGGIASVKNGKIVFDPNGDFDHLGQGDPEDVTFTYTVRNSLDHSKTSTATITITVTGVNSKPIISGTYDDLTITEKGIGEIPLSDLLALASDENGDTLTISDVNTTTPGVNVKIENGKVIYNPGTTFYGLKGRDPSATDSFTFTVSDGKGGLVDGTVNVTITGVDDPLSVDDNQELTVTSTGTAGQVTASPIKVNDLDKNDSYKYTMVVDPLSGPTGKPLPNFTINENTGVISVIRAELPDKTEIGEEYIVTITVTNAFDLTDTDTATIKIKVIENQPPTTVPVVIEGIVREDATEVTQKIEASDPEGDAFVFLPNPTIKSFEIDRVNQLSLPTGFDITIGVNPNNPNETIITFKPNGAFAAIPSGKPAVVVFEYQVQDTVNGGISTNTITINMIGVDTPPTLNGTIPRQETDENTQIPIDLNPFFTDVDDVVIKAVEILGVSEGDTPTIDANGQILFEPGNHFKGLPQYIEGDNTTYRDVTITFKVKGSDTEYELVVRVKGVNDAPTVVNDDTDEDGKPYSTNRNTGIDLKNLLANDTDPNSDALAIGWVGRGTQGNNIDLSTEAGRTVTFTEGDYVIVSADGKTATYYPGTRYAHLGASADPATATFEYSAKDTYGLSSANKATVSVTVNGADDKPKVVKEFDDLYQGTIGDTPLRIPLSDHFSGTDLNYEILGVTNNNANMINAYIDIDAGTKYLVVVFTDSYLSQNDRTIPAEITLRAYNSGGEEKRTINALTNPETTAEITVVAVKTGNSGGWTADNIPQGDTEFTVGEEYYLEIWISDFANQYIDNFTTGLVTFSISLGYNGTILEIQQIYDADYDEYENNVTLFRDVSTQPNKGTISGEGTENAMITKIGGGSTVNGLGVNSKLRLARILVKAVSEGVTTVNVLQDAQVGNGADSTILLLGRKSTISEDPNIHDKQIQIAPVTVTHKPVGAPLLGEETPEVITTGGVYTRVVTETTQTDAHNMISSLPDNADWIHEWQSHWAELWVKASDLVYLKSAGCNLSFNSNYFSATDVELSSAFRTGNIQIDNETGTITGIGGDASQYINSDGYILLGRVKFESLAGNNVLFSEASYAHSLDIIVSNAKVVTSQNEVISVTGKSPKTELWAMPFDANDDGIIDLADFTFFANAFTSSEEASTADAAYFSIFDFDKNGTVALNDLTYFLNNFGYGKSKDNGFELKFSSVFTQRYVGELTTDNTETVNKLIDAANKAWQEALGLDRPVDIQIVVKDLSGIGNGNELANAQITAVDQNGLPLKGIIVLDDDGAGMGWYSQIAEPVANGRYDLYTTLLHEMGHVYGFNTNYEAFSEVVGQYLGQLDGTGMHASNSDDLMYATLATGVRKFISEFDVSIINSAYDAAKADGTLSFSDAVSASTAALTAGSETQLQNSAAFLEQADGSFVTVAMFPTVASVISPTRMVDDNTAARLHAMGLAVGMPLNMQQKEESRVNFTLDQVYSENQSLFDLSDDDLMSLHQPQDVDKSEQALIDLSLDLDV